MMDELLKIVIELVSIVGNMNIDPTRSEYISRDRRIGILNDRLVRYLELETKPESERKKMKEGIASFVAYGPASRCNTSEVGEAKAKPCPDGLLPDGERCPRCGGPRAASGVDGGSWVHCTRIATPPPPDANEPFPPCIGIGGFCALPRGHAGVCQREVDLLKDALRNLVETAGDEPWALREEREEFDRALSEATKLLKRFK